MSHDPAATLRALVLSRKDISRIFSRVVVDRSTGCWTWTGSTAGGGYGSIRLAGKTRRVHRAVYEGFIEAVPDGLELDHLCRNRACCNPAHLEAVTHRENTLRGIGVAAVNAAKTECPYGHPLSAWSRHGQRWKRWCQTCELAHKRRLNSTKRARPGMCRDCSTAEATPGYRTCPTCREKNLVRELLRRSLSSALDKVLRSKSMQVHP